jgi:hypothetical protein
MLTALVCGSFISQALNSQSPITLQEAQATYLKVVSQVNAHSTTLRTTEGALSEHFQYAGLLKELSQAFGSPRITSVTREVTSYYNPETQQMEDHVLPKPALESQARGTSYYEFHARRFDIQVNEHVAPDGLTTPEDACTIALVPAKGYRFSFTVAEFLKSVEGIPDVRTTLYTYLFTYDQTLHKAKNENGGVGSYGFSYGFDVGEGWLIVAAKSHVQPVRHLYPLLIDDARRGKVSAQEVVPAPDIMNRLSSERCEALIVRFGNRTPWFSIK